MTTNKNEFDMPGRENQVLMIECSWCLREQAVTFLQIANEERIRCECGKDILLVDEDGSIGRMMGKKRDNNGV